MRFSLPLCMLLLGGVMLFSCKKPTLDGNGTVPNNSLGVTFTDTLTLRTYTVREDSLLGSYQPLNLLGVINEPVFGKTVASIYSQFTLPVDNMTLGSNIHVDSTVLCLALNGNYGNNKVPMNIQVYRMNQVIYVDSFYYSGRIFPVQPTLLGSLTNYVPDLNDSVHLNRNNLDYDSLPHAPQIRIRLNNPQPLYNNNTLGQDIASQSGVTNVVDNNNDFQNYFNGLYITVDTNKGGANMVYLNLGSIDSHLSIYYRSSTNSDTTRDTVVYLYSNSLAATVSHFTHNYANSSVASVLGSTNPLGDNLLFCSGLAGVKGKFYVPYIKNLGNIAINKAEMVFTVVSDSTTYPTPANITVNKLSSTGMDTSISDQAISSYYFGGTKNYGLTPNSGGATQYGVNLARYYQNIVQGGIDSGLYVFPTPATRDPSRVVFGGGTNAKYKVKLNLTYTKIN